MKNLIPLFIWLNDEETFPKGEKNKPIPHSHYSEMPAKVTGKF